MWFTPLCKRIQDFRNKQNVHKKQKRAQKMQARSSRDSPRTIPLKLPVQSGPTVPVEANGQCDHGVQGDSADAAALREEMASLGAQLASSQAALETARQEVSSLSSENVGLSVRARSHDELVPQLEAVQTELVAAVSASNELQSSLEGVQEQLVSRGAAHDALSEQHADLQGCHDELLAEHSQVLEQLSTTASSQEKMQGLMELAQQSAAELAEQSATEMARLDEAQAGLAAQHERTISDAAAEHAEVMASQRAALEHTSEEQVEKMTAELAELRAQLGGAEEAAAELAVSKQAEVDGLACELKELRAAWASAESAHAAELQAMRVQQENGREAAEAAQSALRAEIETLQAMHEQGGRMDRMKRRADLVARTPAQRGAVQYQCGDNKSFQAVFMELNRQGVLTLKKAPAGTKGLASVVPRTSSALGCVVGELKKPRKGQPHAFRLDLGEGDSEGDLKYVLSVDTAEEKQHWMSRLKQWSVLSADELAGIVKEVQALEQGEQADASDPPA